MPPKGVDAWPILICLLGEFRLLKQGQIVPVRSGGKTETLLRALAIRPLNVLPRDNLIFMLWPQCSGIRGGQSLHSLIYSLRRLLGDCINASPIVRSTRGYRLNVEAGIGVDVSVFDDLAEYGMERARATDQTVAAKLFGDAISLYRGDLSDQGDPHSIIERERLRAVYLTLLARLADYYYTIGDFATALRHALHLLSEDPCREDAHRLSMRCHVRLGHRAQAMRQYRLCERMLREEFDAAPEEDTRAVFERIRLGEQLA